MRIDNAAAALSQGDPKAKVVNGKAVLLLPQSNRLSSSCPSLNNSLQEPDLVNNNAETPRTTAQSSSSRNRRNRAANQSSKAAARKRQGHRHRSVSVSSGDSDVDAVDGTAASVIKSRQRSSSSHHHHVTGRSSTAPVVSPYHHPPSAGAHESGYNRFFQPR